VSFMRIFSYNLQILL